MRKPESNLLRMTADPITRLNAALEGRYRIESELGEGGMAMVLTLDRRVPCLTGRCAAARTRGILGG